MVFIFWPWQWIQEMQWEERKCNLVVPYIVFIFLQLWNHFVLHIQINKGYGGVWQNTPNSYSVVIVVTILINVEALCRA